MLPSGFRRVGSTERKEVVNCACSFHPWRCPSIYQRKWLPFICSDLNHKPERPRGMKQLPEHRTFRINITRKENIRNNGFQIPSIRPPGADEHSSPSQWLRKIASHPSLHLSIHIPLCKIKPCLINDSTSSLHPTDNPHPPFLSFVLAFPRHKKNYVRKRKAIEWDVEAVNVQ